MRASVQRSVVTRRILAWFFLFVRVFLLRMPIKSSAAQEPQACDRRLQKSLAGIDFIVQNGPAQPLRASWGLHTKSGRDWPATSPCGKRADCTRLFTKPSLGNITAWPNYLDIVKPAMSSTAYRRPVLLPNIVVDGNAHIALIPDVKAIRAIQFHLVNSITNLPFLILIGAVPKLNLAQGILDLIHSSANRLIRT
jgi:hypothetical protein